MKKSIFYKQRQFPVRLNIDKSRDDKNYGDNGDLNISQFFYMKNVVVNYI